MYACYRSINGSYKDHKSNIEGYCLNQQSHRLARNWLVSTCLFQIYHHPHLLHTHTARVHTHTNTLLARLDDTCYCYFY